MRSCTFAHRPMYLPEIALIILDKIGLGFSYFQCARCRMCCALRLLCRGVIATVMCNAVCKTLAVAVWSRVYPMGQRAAHVQDMCCCLNNRVKYIPANCFVFVCRFVCTTACRIFSHQFIALCVCRAWRARTDVSSAHKKQ